MRGFRRIFFFACFVCMAMLVAPLWAESKQRSSKSGRVFVGALSAEDAAALKGAVEVRVRARLLAQNPSYRLHGVRLDAESGEVLIELGKEYLPPGMRVVSVALTDRLDELRSEVWVAFQERNVHPYSTSFTFDGYDLSHYYPEDFPIHDEQSSIPTDLQRLGGPGQIVVSAGHGIYYHRGYADWRFQRDPSNGIIEDRITQLLSDDLAEMISQRGNHSPIEVRSESTNLHVPSGYPWNDVSARYYLQEFLPHRKDIWNSLAHLDSYPLIEYDEDIRTRPLYANAISASALFSLHTNGGNPDASGAEVIHHTGRIVPRDLGNSIACYMEELINAQENYVDFYVKPTSTPLNNKGENTHSAAPAVIVEVAYHTNASDAAALQDPVFRLAAMKGIEKGSRLYEDGEPCTHYEITDIPDVQAPWGTTIGVPVSFEGYPQYPVGVEIENISCGSLCTPGSGTIPSEVPSPFQINMVCDGDAGAPPSVSTWRVVLQDEDLVTTEYDFTSTCGVAGSPGRLSVRDALPEISATIRAGDPGQD